MISSALPAPSLRDRSASLRTFPQQIQAAFLKLLI
jgi:hypothetical protein